MTGIITYSTNGRKDININAMPPEAWTIFRGGGTSGEEGDLQELWRLVPWLNRSIVLLGNGLANLPFIITNEAGDEVDSSEDYQNVVGVWPDPFTDLWLMEASLSLFGRSYWLRQKRKLGRLTLAGGIRYLAPHTIDPEIDEERGLTGFTRHLDGKDKDLKPEDLVYFWMPDPFGEIGPPNWSRAIAAMAAAGVLKSVDEFATAFFERGAIKTTLLRVDPNMPAAERQRTKALWGRIARGLKSAWTNMVINSGGLDPVVVGDGIGDLGNTSLTDEKRKEISAAMGVPESALWSSAANFAVKEGDQRDLYTNTIIPDSRPIASGLNASFLGPLGYRVKFAPQHLDIFQEDEEDRSGAILNLVSAATSAPAPVVRLIFETLGVDLPGGMEWDEFESILADAKAEAVEAAPAAEPSLRPAPDSLPPEEPGESEGKSLAEIMDKWERKALKRLASSGSAYCDFEHPALPAELGGLIAEMLDEATTPEQVKAIFRVVEG